MPRRGGTGSPELYVRFRRTHARPSASDTRGAAFLDRDGVINDDQDYVNTPAEFALLPGAACAIRRLNDAGVPVVVVTNQGGVAFGYLSVADLDSVHDEMDRQLAKEGAHVDAVYAALAHPEGSVRELRRESIFRKPAAGMLHQAADDLALDLRQSILVGDTTTDVQAGRSAGCRTILVRTGYGGRDGQANVVPDAVVPDLAAAVEWILSIGAQGPDAV
jgi:histidinol-phosphate phosphatase family protein